MKNISVCVLFSAVSSWLRVFRMQNGNRMNLFPGRWIRRGGTLKWPPRSPVLSPLYYHFRDYTKISVRTQVEEKYQLRQ